MHERGGDSIFYPLIIIDYYDIFECLDSSSNLQGASNASDLMNVSRTKAERIDMVSLISFCCLIGC